MFTEGLSNIESICPTSLSYMRNNLLFTLYPTSISPLFLCYPSFWFLEDSSKNIIFYPSYTLGFLKWHKITEIYCFLWNSDKSQWTVLGKCHHLSYSSDYIPFYLDCAGRSMLNSFTSLAPLHGLSLTLSPFPFSFPSFSLSLSPHGVLSLNNLATFFMTWRSASLESTEGRAARPLQSEDWNSTNSVLHIPIITRPAQIQREWLK